MKTQQLITKLREKGYKVTPQRLAICELALSSKAHPTADQIHKEIIRKFSTISLATVYQTLHLLTDMGLLQELGFSDRSSRYDANITPHINIVCLKCGKIYDYEAKSVKKLWSQIVENLGFKPIGQRLDVYRYCDKCSKEIARSKRAHSEIT
jgi:Fur family peroxide stress response transcriptional regulator